MVNRKSSDETLDGNSPCGESKLFDFDALKNFLDLRLEMTGLFELLQDRCPYLFASSTVFVEKNDIATMDETVKVLVDIFENQDYQNRVLSYAPIIASAPHFRLSGVFFGFDFHKSVLGIRLIEVNSNAGGALINCIMTLSQKSTFEVLAADAQVFERQDIDSGEDFELKIINMFQNEWKLSGKSGSLKSIAIVDLDPESQFLYPEFLLFQNLFLRYGIKCLIVDPKDLEIREGSLWSNGVHIDLVYNRLTDFYFDLPSSKNLREAYLQSAALVTPNPRHYAIYGDKRNLAILSSRTELSRLGVAKEAQDILLSIVPHTEIVQEEKEEQLWSERKKYFFKPINGYGGKAVYRGDKLSKRVWVEILKGGYIAQSLIPPGEVTITSMDASEKMKFDLRSYVYEGEIQWMAARVYRGQTTNFRTKGGGFARVLFKTNGHSLK